MRANLSVHEPRQPQDADTALAFSMEGHNGVQAGERPAALTPFAWAPGWNSPQSWNKYMDEVGGHSLGGDAGVRLIEPAANAPSRAVDGIAAMPRQTPLPTGRFEVIVAHHIFGSEELSAKAPPMQSRIPAPYVALNDADADALGWAEGAAVMVALEGVEVELPLQRHPLQARGTVAIPRLPGAPFAVAGRHAEVRAAVRA